MTTIEEVKIHLRVKAALMGEPMSSVYTVEEFRQHLCINAKVEYHYWLKDHHHVLANTRIKKICQLYLKYLPKE